MAILPKIIESTTGFKTLYCEELDETYHSQHGAIAESLHVFIKEGLQYWLNTNPSKSLSILEMGFGTGLNAMLSLMESERLKLTVLYHSLETIPLEYELIKKLNFKTYWGQDAENIFRQLHEADWENEFALTNVFTIRKINDYLEQYQFNVLYDLVYFDAFSPDKQPELWQLSIFQKLFKTMNSGAVLVTYSAKGEVRRNLMTAGFTVHKIEGPLMKRHMLRAIKP